MACLLKIPTARSAGVMTITDRERDALLPPTSPLRAKIARLSPRWLVGCHHNWHDLEFVHDPLFAFSLAGEHDLREKHHQEFVHIPMDAANFVPECFHRESGERHWDLLLVARAVVFKELPEAFQSIRTLLDGGHRIRTLVVCPLPESTEATNTDVETCFRQTFTPLQQGLTSLLTFRYRYPFPLDLESLAFLYRSAKVFVYFAPTERRPRNVAYAWVSGMPVVARDQIGLMLPEALRQPPYFYRFSTPDDWQRIVPVVLQQVNARPADFAKVAAEFSTPTAIQKLRDQFSRRGWALDDKGWARNNLGIRIARHHGLDSGYNSLRMTLSAFVEILGDPNQQELLTSLQDADDPERLLDERVVVAEQRPSLLRRWFAAR